MTISDHMQILQHKSTQIGRLVAGGFHAVPLILKSCYWNVRQIALSEQYIELKSILVIYCPPVLYWRYNWTFKTLKFPFITFSLDAVRKFSIWKFNSRDRLCNYEATTTCRTRFSSNIRRLKHANVYRSLIYFDGNNLLNFPAIANRIKTILTECVGASSMYDISER